MSEGHIRLDGQGPVAWITIDNPQRRNAVSLTMWRELDAILTGIGSDTRCILVHGAGGRAFAAGADISEFAGQRRSLEDVREYDLVANTAMARLHEMPQPTVAMISGFCIGGGVALALSCDIRIASEGSQFAIPAARLGLGYGAPNLKRLLDVVSVPVALDIMASARRFGAAEALRMGLVNRICPAASLEAECKAYIGDIACNAPLTIAAAKRTIRELAKSSPAADLDLCANLAETCFASDDYLEGIRAFMEKRDPIFSGR